MNIIDNMGVYLIGMVLGMVCVWFPIGMLVWLGYKIERYERGLRGHDGRQSGDPDPSRVVPARKSSRWGI